MGISKRVKNSQKGHWCERALIWLVGWLLGWLGVGGAVR
jgi:hypothetical protein